MYLIVWQSKNGGVSAMEKNNNQNGECHWSLGSGSHGNFTVDRGCL